jgi:hypothetical protein
MTLSYFSTWNATRQLKRVYVTMSLFLEQPDVNQNINLYFSVQDPDTKEWDIGRCSVKYTGRVNTDYVTFTASDHYSQSLPYDGGLD